MSEIHTDAQLEIAQDLLMRVLFTLDIVQLCEGIARLADDPMVSRLGAALAERPLLADGKALAETVEAVTAQVESRTVTQNLAVLAMLNAAEAVEALSIEDERAVDAMGRFAEVGLNYLQHLGAAPRELAERLRRLRSQASGA